VSGQEGEKMMKEQGGDHEWSEDKDARARRRNKAR
jgi:hypothetical protein